MNIQKCSLIMVAFFLLLLSFLLGCGGDETATSTPVDLPTLEPPIPTATDLIPTQPPAPTETLTAEPTAEQPPTETAVSATDTPSATQPPPCGPPAGWVPYTVQPNNTLYSLAKWTNTTVGQIQQANCMNDTLIYVGQPLYLPFIPLPPPTAVIPPEITPSPSATVEKPTAPPTGDPRIEVVPGSGPAGTTFTFRIRDFAPSEVITVRITYDIDDTIIDSFEVTMDADGNKDAEWESPGDLAAGPYVVTPIRSDGTLGIIGEFLLD